MSEIKPFSGVDDRVLLSKAIPLTTPFTIGIAPSNACNFKCNYCFQSMDSEQLNKQYQFKKEIMSLPTFMNVISQLSSFPNKIKLMSFMGQGEPLVNKNLATMINLAKSCNKIQRVDVVTNASLLKPEKSDELINSGLDALRISLQGINSESYKKISNVDLNFSELIYNIKYFFNKSRGKCKVFVKIMDTALDPSEKDKFYALFDSITDRMFIEEIKPVYDGVNYKKFKYTLTTDRRGLKHEKRYVCPQPFFTLSVWPNGEVIPCSALHKVCNLGNVNTGSLFDMWNSDQLKGFQRIQLKKLRYYHPQCKLCCAPDDCAHVEDVLDNEAEEILRKDYY